MSIAVSFKPWAQQQWFSFLLSFDIEYLKHREGLCGETAIKKIRDIRVSEWLFIDVFQQRAVF